MTQWPHVCSLGHTPSSSDRDNFTHLTHLAQTNPFDYGACQRHRHVFCRGANIVDLNVELEPVENVLLW
jgi:hypothetical protein